MAEQGSKAIPSKGSGKPQEERPELAEFLRWKRSATKIHWQLIDGSALLGTLNWFDNYNVQVHVDAMGNLTIPKHSILWYKEAIEP